jgi:5-methylcytosine-specific restriction endonuclease McrA
MSRGLTTLKPRVQAANTNRVPILEAKAGTTERVRGGKWVKTRQRIAVAQQFKCQGCGCVWLPWRDQVDHHVPLEQGGSNDDSNLNLLCLDCHTTKTASEAKGRSAAGAL